MPKALNLVQENRSDQTFYWWIMAKEKPTVEMIINKWKTMYLPEIERPTRISLYGMSMSEAEKHLGPRESVSGFHMPTVMPTVTIIQLPYAFPLSKSKLYLAIIVDPDCNLDQILRAGKGGSK